MKKKITEQPWFNYAFAACIAILFYVFLTHLDGIRGGIRTFLGYFSPVLLGGVIAYLVNPLAKVLAKYPLRWIKKESTRQGISDVIAFIIIILAIVLLLLLLIPQLIESITLFVSNLDGYVNSLLALMERAGVSAHMLDLEDIISSSENLIQTVTTLIKNNINTILSTSVNVGKIIAQIIIAFLLSMYLLADKRRLKKGSKRLMRGLLGDAKYDKALVLLRRCNAILNRYIVYNIIDSLIVGIVNAILMTIFGMPYAGLVSFVVAVTNLIPTFGPIFGAVIGAFILVLVNPWHALVFLIFTVILQGLDAYVIKPKLFGDSLGVSGLWILVGVIVGGRMFGVIGILLAIPMVAILDLLYQDYFMPWLESRKQPPETDK